MTEVSEKASLLVREEIELAKAEITSKVSKLTKGAAVAGAAGVFLDLRHHDALPHARLVPRRPVQLGSAGPGFLAVTILLFVLAGLAGVHRACGSSRRASPPTPDLAIEEAKLIREQFEAQNIQRDQVHRTLETRRGGDPLMAGSRSPELIRQSIEETRRELAFSVNDLRSKVSEITDWRGQLTRNRSTALVGAAVAGFVIGGGVAATLSLFSRRRR